MDDTPMPRWPYVLRMRVRSLFRRTRVEDDLNDELRDHLEQQIAAEVERGVPAAQARTSALRALGGLEPLKETLRDARRVGLIDQLIRDTQYGVRMLRRSPGFTAVATLSLALGTGANIAVFQLPLVVVGLGLGVGTALLGSRSARALLYGLPPDDLLTVAAAVLLLGAAAVAAALVPARRASNLDPVSALRTE